MKTPKSLAYYKRFMARQHIVIQFDKNGENGKVLHARIGASQEAKDRLIELFGELAKLMIDGDNENQDTGGD